MVLANKHLNLVDATHPSSDVRIDLSLFQGYDFQQHPVRLERSITNDSPYSALQPNLVTRSGSRGRFVEEWDAGQRGSSIIETHHFKTMEPSEIFPGAVVEPMESDIHLPSRSTTLKKTASLKRESSFKKSSSRRGSTAGSLKGLGQAIKSERPLHDMQSAFYCPIPTTGDPTETLANRFSAWRKVLKDLITYFREIASHYEHRAKANIKLSNVVNNMQNPSIFLQNGGIDDALSMLKIYHKDSVVAANRARDIESDVILVLTGLRVDLSAKIKEIKGLSGDFKNSVDKEMNGTRRAVQNLEDALRSSEREQGGKQDPYLLRMAADRQVERQIDEENYLQQAHLNLEQSGRELEAIIVGEIQKSYNAYASILKREAEEAQEIIQELKAGPISMPKDREWQSFIKTDKNFINPSLPMRHAEHVHYPGRDSELATEVRAGLLERKSKYLKSYTPGWYVLSPTYLHEFKSADKTQAPIMSLHLSEQKLGSHSEIGSSSNKFILKGKQTGGVHRGHSWVFRAESHDTMMAWYQAIKTLTESAPQERSAFVRQHARSVSGFSQRSKAGSISSDGALDGDEDDEPFSAANSQTVINVVTPEEKKAVRPQPGGRFPSDLQLNTQRSLQAPLSPSSESSDFREQIHDKNIAAAAAEMPDSGRGKHYGVINSPTHATELKQMVAEDGVNPYSARAIEDHQVDDLKVDDTPNAPTDGRHLFASAAAGLERLSLGATGPETVQNHETYQTEGLETADGRSGQYAQDIFPGAVPYSAEAIALQEQAAREAEVIATPGDDLNQYLYSNSTNHDNNHIEQPPAHKNAAAFHKANLAAYESPTTAANDADMVVDGPVSPETEVFPAFVSGGRSMGDLTDMPKPTFSSEANMMSAGALGHDSQNSAFIPLEAEPTPNTEVKSDPVHDSTATLAAQEASKEAQLLRSHLTHEDVAQRAVKEASQEAKTLRSNLSDVNSETQSERPPTLGEVRQFASTSTISNLHVPGEFPKERSNKGTVYEKLPV